MAGRGKSINLFLMDGSADGRIKCTMANWTGIAYKIPRTEIDKCKDRDDLKQSGVYLLFGVSDDTGKNVVYIGQAGERKNGEGILYRLIEHKRNPDKDYWTEAVVFTTSNNSFGPTEISYLEHRLCSIATEANRYTVKNANDPTLGHVTEEKESELEEFLDYVKVIMGTLGHKVFMPIKASVSEQEKIENEPDQRFYLKTSKVDACGIRSSEGFVVLKGSVLAGKPTPSCPDYVKRFRELYQEKIDRNHCLTEDVQFSSPSSAGAFVNYASTNGLTAWVTEDGRTLKAMDSSEA